MAQMEVKYWFDSDSTKATLARAETGAETGAETRSHHAHQEVNSIVDLNVL